MVEYPNEIQKEIARLHELGMPEMPFSLTPGEADEAIDILKKLLNTEDHQEMVAKALGLAKATQEAASKVEFYIFWINNGEGGRGLRRGITRDKKEGENLLLELRRTYPGAVIRWEGPVDYYTGRRTLECTFN